MAEQQRMIATPAYTGPDRRHDDDPDYKGPERRSEYLAFGKAVKQATMAATREITQTYLRRMMWLLIAITIAIVAAVAIPVELSADKANQSSVNAGLRRNCNLVVATNKLFIDYLNHQIQLREQSGINNTPSVREFNHANDDFWLNVILPALKKFTSGSCSENGSISTNK